MKKNKIRKGDYGYIQSQKRKRTWITIAAFIAPMLVFFTGLILKDTRKSVFTVIAVVASLPGCKFATTMIMMYLQKPMTKKAYDAISAHIGTLTAGYELVVSAYEKQTFLDCIVVVGNTVVGYSSRDKADAPFAEQHIQKILRGNGYAVTVKIMKQLPLFLDRLDGLNEHQESLRKDIKFTPNETYPDLTREELILHTIYAISL